METLPKLSLILETITDFIDDIPRHRDDMEITATIIAMARTLRLDVLAEGVETKASLESLYIYLLRYQVTKNHH